MAKDAIKRFWEVEEESDPVSGFNDFEEHDIRALVEKVEKQSEHHLTTMRKELAETQDKLDRQIKEINLVKNQMFAIVGFMITIFTFISAATNFYSPILDMVGMFTADIYSMHQLNLLELGLDLLLDILFLGLPIAFLGATFWFAERFFRNITKN